MKSSSPVVIPPLAQRLFSVWYRHVRVYTKNLISNGLPPFLEPLLFLAGVGLGLGKYITESMDGLSYIDFLGTGLLVTAAMFTAAYDNRSRLGDVWQANLKIEKAFKLGDTSRMYFSIDLFNVLNLDTIMRKYDISLGTFRVAGLTPISRTAPALSGAGSGNINEIMNPFIFRLGMRFQI